MGHIHAELMAQYAEDAKQLAKPWELWQHGDDRVWSNCTSHPSWHIDFYFRRKHQTTVFGEHVNAEILRAIADGKKVQYRDVEKGEDGVQNGPWKDFDANSIEACWNLLASGNHQWRIAPKTIKIGGFEVPEPCREAPKAGQEFCAINPFSGPQWFTWNGSEEDLHALESGFVHLTKEAAETHYKAFKNLLGK